MFKNRMCYSSNMYWWYYCHWTNLWRRTCWWQLPVKKGNNSWDLLKLVKKRRFTLRELSSLIGTLASTFQVNKFGSLHYWKLDKCTALGLKKTKGNFDTLIKLRKEATLHLQWWITKFVYSVKKKGPRQYQSYLHWCINAWMGDILWQNLFKEKNWPVNGSELKSIFLSLISIAKDHRIHVKVFSDSNTVIARINKLAVTYPYLSDIGDFLGKLISAESWEGTVMPPYRSRAKSWWGPGSKAPGSSKDLNSEINYVWLKYTLHNLWWN